jgi:hypothetical protein
MHVLPICSRRIFDEDDAEVVMNKVTIKLDS